MTEEQQQPRSDDPITKELECPVCFNQMEPPIEMCNNGHNLCSGCKPQLERCPLCEAPFCNVRNRALEAIAENILYPCVNSSLGCDVKCRSAERDEHLKICPHKGLECLPYKKSGCVWRGKPADLCEHLKNSHNNCNIFENFPVQVHFFMQVPINAVRVARVDDALFWVHLRQDPANEKYFRAVQYLGDPEDAAKWEYSYQLNLKDDSNTAIGYKRNVYSKDVDIDKEYEENKTMSVLLRFIKESGHDKSAIVSSFKIYKGEKKV